MRGYFNLHIFKKVGVFVLILAILFGPATPLLKNNPFKPTTVHAADAWWNNSWTKRVKVTFDNSTRGALTDFPVSISLNGTRVTYGDFKAGGADIRFVDADGSTVLNHEVEKWDISGTSTIWTKIPQIASASSTDYIYMYYGNSGATSNATTTGVWDANYTAVQHFAEDPTGPSPQFQDSTLNNKDGIASSSGGPVVASVTTGRFGNALDFNGTSHLVDEGDTPLGSLPNGSAEFWYDIDSIATIANNRYLFSRVKTASNDGELRVYIDTSGGANTGKLVYQIECTLPSAVSTTTVATVSSTVDTWNHVVATWDDDTTGAMKLYVNGVQVGAANTTTCGAEATAVNTNLGRNNALFNGYLDGQMDELRVSTVARSADWINASYVSGIDTLNTYTAPESLGDITPPVITTGATSTAATTASIEWVTDEAATSTVVYGLTSSYGSTATSSGTSTHSVALNGLASSTTYHYKIIATDASGNTSSTTDATFTTTGTTSPGQPTGLVLVPYDTRILALWTTASGTVSDYVIEYKLTTEPTTWTVFSDGTSVATSTMITGLTTGSAYNVRVTASNSGTLGTPSSIGTSTPAFLMSFLSPTIGQGNSTTSTSITAYASTTSASPSYFTFRLETGGGALVSSATTSVRYGDYALNHVTELSHRTNLALTVTDLSGQVYVPTTNTLFTVHNNQNKITEVTPAGVTVRTITCSSCGDIEDITLVSSVASTTALGVYDHTFMISTEDVDINNLQIFRVVIPSTGTVTVNRNDYFSTGIAAAGTNDGLEGIAYNANTNTYFVSVEGQFTQATQPKVYEVTLGSGHTTSTSTVCSNLNFRDYLTEDNTAPYGNTTYADISGLNYVPSVDRLYVISHKADKIIEVDVSNRNSCTVLNQLPIAMRADSGANHDFEMPEGVAWDGTGDYMYVSAESDYWSVWRTTSYGVRSVFTGLSSGSYNLYTSVTDTYGNTSTSSARSFSINTDVTAPSITLGATSTTATTSSIAWTTNEAATSTVIYGTTASYGSTATSSGTSTHSVLLSGLTPLTTYHYQIVAVDAAGNTSSTTDATFTTTAGPDVTAPTITLGATSTATTTASIAWTTNEAASSTIQYGLTTSYGLTATSVGTSTHSVALTGLASTTTYHYRIVATDASLNTSSTTDATFTTLDGTAPTITSAATSTSISTSTATITWTTDETSTSVVDYGTTLGYGTASSSATRVTSHTIYLGSLTPNTTYHYRVTSVDAVGNATSSTDATFTTAALPDTTAPNLSSIASSTTAYTATIQWNTNEDADSQVNYGLTSGYGTASSSVTLESTHSIQLSGLTPSTTYHFQIVSRDAASNATTSTDYTFRTLADTTPPVISSVTVVPTTTGATISWVTNENASSSAMFGTSSVYASTSTSSANTSHSVTLSGFTENTLIHYAIYAQDMYGNVSTTTDATFTTSVTPTTNPAPATSAGVGPTGGSGGGSSGASSATPQAPVTPVQSQNNQQPQANTSVGLALQALAQQNIVVQNIQAQGKKNNDVKNIQKILNADPATRIAKTGPGSPGKETNLYGPATKAAVQKFQLKYGIVKSPRDTGYGVVGPKTRAKMNELLGKKS